MDIVRLKYLFNLKNLTFLKSEIYRFFKLIIKNENNASYGLLEKMLQQADWSG